MKANFYKSAGIVLLLVAFCAIAVSVAEASTFRIDQAKVRLSIPAGSAASGEIKVENPSSATLRVKAYIEDWRYLPAADGTKEFSPASSSEFSSADWISFAPTEFSIPAFGRQIVRYTVRVPRGAVGGRFAVLFFETELGPEESVEAMGLMVRVRLGSLFYVEAKNTVRRAAQLSDFSVKNARVDERQLLISADFKNIGNTDITCAGTFHIMDRRGMVFARGEFNDIYTFPWDSARLSSTWKEPLARGLYDIVVTLNLGKAQEEFGLGRGPVIVREAQLEIGEGGRVIKVGELN